MKNKKEAGGFFVAKQNTHRPRLIRTDGLRVQGKGLVMTQQIEKNNNVGGMYCGQEE